MKRGNLTLQKYAGRMADAISHLIGLKEDLRNELINDGYSPEKANDITKKIYEAAWEYVNFQVVEE